MSLPIREPANYPLVIAQGSELIRTIGFFYRDENDERQLLDTAGYRVRYQIRRKHGDPVLFTGGTHNGRAIAGIQGTAPRQWNLLIRIPASETEQFPGGEICVWDIELDPPGSPDSRRRMMEGPVIITPQVTIA